MSYWLPIALEILIEMMPRFCGFLMLALTS